MVITKQSQESKNPDKSPSVKILKPAVSEDLRVVLSPEGSPTSNLEEIHALRARNKVLTDALKAIKETADKEALRHYELVWFARNRNRYPNHEARKRIEEEHHDELEKLASPDADYFHGVHSGLLAASRMFQKQADILHINKHDEVTDVLLSEAAKHAKKVEESLEEFPKVEVGDLPTSAH